jgi:hypothetical protein
MKAFVLVNAHGKFKRPPHEKIILADLRPVAKSESSEASDK